MNKLNKDKNHKLNVIANQTIVLIVIMIIVKGVSFLRDIVLTTVYGSSSISDAFIIAVSVPTVLISGIMAALYTSYIPIYKELKNDNETKIPGYNTNLTLLTVFLSAIILIMYLLLEDYVLKLFAFGFDNDTFYITKVMTQIMIFNVLIMGIEYILQGYLQANNKFYLVAANTIPLNLIIIGGIISSKDSTYIIIPISVTVGYIFLLLYFSIPAYKSGFKMSTQVNFKEPSVVRTIKMVIPIFIGQSIFEVNSIVDKSMASLLPTGGVTVMDYSFKVMSISYAIIVNPIATILFPRFADLVVKKDRMLLERTLEKVLEVISLIMFPVMFAIIICSKEIVEILFYHGEFSVTAVERTVEALNIYALSIVPISLRLILEKVFYASQEPITPMLNSFYGIAINIILDIMLVKTWGHQGLAFATSVSVFVTFIVFLLKICNLYRGMNVKKIVCKFVEYGTLSGIAMFISDKFSAWLDLNSNILIVLMNICLASIIYIVILLLIKDKNIMLLYSKVAGNKVK